MNGESGVAEIRETCLARGVWISVWQEVVLAVLVIGLRCQRASCRDEPAGRMAFTLPDAIESFAENLHHNSSKDSAG